MGNSFKKVESKDASIKIRCTSEDLSKLDEEAAKNDISRSELVRLKVFGENKKQLRFANKVMRVLVEMDKDIDDLEACMISMPSIPNKKRMMDIMQNLREKEARAWGI